jgi:predicted enzyme related to lactoylglutathione lyase
MMAKKVEKHGTFSWTELMTTDVEAAKDFYEQLFEWEFSKQDLNDTTYYVIKLKGQNRPVGGILDSAHEQSGDPQKIPPHWGSYVTVRNIKDTVTLVEKLGGTILVPPTKIPNTGFFSVIQDPQGAVISVMEHTF